LYNLLKSQQVTNVPEYVQFINPSCMTYGIRSNVHASKETYYKPYRIQVSKIDQGKDR